MLPTLLLVEDEPAIRQLMARALSGAGYRVLEARTGAEAVAVYERYGADVDLLITDIRMPYLSGVELAAELRRRRRTLKILYVTGYPDDRTSGEPQLVKPFQRDALLGAVERLLKGQAVASSPQVEALRADAPPRAGDLPATAV